MTSRKSKRLRRKRKFNDSTTTTETKLIVHEHRRTQKKRKLSTQARTSGDQLDFIKVSIRSWCFSDKEKPWQSIIKINNKQINNPVKRGHQIVVLDGLDGEVEQTIEFDTWADIYGGVRLRMFLKSLRYRPNKWVIIITNDSGYNINTEAAWPELQRFGSILGDEQARHRESYILIATTNCAHCWYENIANADEYLDCKYLASINSTTSTNGKARGKAKTKARDLVLESLEKYGNKNVLFEEKRAEKKGPIKFNGYLPKLLQQQQQQQQYQYTRPTPMQITIKKNNIRACDSNGFYCNACLSTADQQHMLICSDDAHCDDKSRFDTNVQMQLELQSVGITARQEIEKKFRVVSYGQAFHLYCVQFPNQLWPIWAKYMNLPSDELQNKFPAFVELNMKQQRMEWRRRELGGGQYDTVKNKPRKLFSDSSSEDETKLKLQPQLQPQCRLDVDVDVDVNDSDSDNDNSAVVRRVSFDTGNIEFCQDEEVNLTPVIRDLANWCCSQHSRGHRLFCRCGLPMVAQTCKFAHGECNDQDSEFLGLYCNHRDCVRRIKPEEILFRCCDGVRCRFSDDGWEFCIDCSIKEFQKLKPNVHCFCGNPLQLGRVSDIPSIVENVKQSFSRSLILSDKNNTKSISVAGVLHGNGFPMYLTSKNFPVPPEQNVTTINYLCALCLKPCQSLNQQIYYCAQQSMKCFRVLRNRSNKEHFHPYFLCIACAVQSELMFQLCDCGANLHCRLVADCIFHDPIAFGFGSSSSPTSKPSKPSKPCRNQNQLPEESYYAFVQNKYIQCDHCPNHVSAFSFVFICNDKSKHQNTPHYLCGKCSVRQRPMPPLYPQSKEMVEICLLFVAHDGISQPELWKQWLNEFPQLKHKVGVAIQCNNSSDIKCGAAFVERYRIDVQRPTAWGRLLVPLTIQRSLQIALSKFPNCKRFYIVSGREIPLVSLQHLLAMPNKSQIMCKKVVGTAKKKITKKSRLSRLLQWYSHHAAMCLVRDHCCIVSVAPWKEYFNDSDAIFKGVGAPDEFLFGTTLASCSIDIKQEVWREVTTDFEIPPIKRVQHPVTWISLNTPTKISIMHSNMNVPGNTKICLLQLLRDHFNNPSKLWGYGPCFFRKITSTVDFKDILPWKMCLVKPPIVNQELRIDETLIYRSDLNSSAFMEPDELKIAAKIEKTQHNQDDEDDDEDDDENKNATQIRTVKKGRRRRRKSNAKRLKTNRKHKSIL